MKNLDKWPIRSLISFLLSIGTLAVLAEVAYFLMEISSPTPNKYFLPVSYIPVFYYMFFSIFGSNWVLSIISLALWVTFLTIYIFLRLSENSRGVENRLLKRKYIVLVSLLFAIANIALGMPLAALPILICLPIFMYLPLPRLKPRVDLTSGAL